MFSELSILSKDKLERKRNKKNLQCLLKLFSCIQRLLCERRDSIAEVWRDGFFPCKNFSAVNLPALPDNMDMCTLPRRNKSERKSQFLHPFSMTEMSFKRIVAPLRNQPINVRSLPSPLFLFYPCPCAVICQVLAILFYYYFLLRHS